MRRELRRKDLAEFEAKRPVPSKAASMRRVRSLLESPRAQAAAKKFAGGLRRVCKEVVDKNGARARG